MSKAVSTSALSASAASASSVGTASSVVPRRSGAAEQPLSDAFEPFEPGGGSSGGGCLRREGVWL